MLHQTGPRHYISSSFTDMPGPPSQPVGILCINTSPSWPDKKEHFQHWHIANSWQEFLMPWRELGWRKWREGDGIWEEYPKELTWGITRKKKKTYKKLNLSAPPKVRSKCSRFLSTRDFSKKGGHSLWCGSHTLPENLPFLPLPPPFLGFFLWPYYAEKSHLFLFEGISSALPPAPMLWGRWPLKWRKATAPHPLSCDRFRKK